MIPGAKPVILSTFMDKMFRQKLVRSQVITKKKTLALNKPDTS